MKDREGENNFDSRNFDGRKREITKRVELRNDTRGSDFLRF